MILHAEALAKINRELRVGPRRADGYHEIRSRFTSIDVADRISVVPDGEITLGIRNFPDAPPPDENLAVRAARLLASRFAVRAGARIEIEKRIPAGAGLGGGSADAAVTLVLLAKLWRLDASAAELAPLGAEVGSDVPYFFTGGEANVSGRGERITPLPDAPPRNLLLIVPPFALATSKIYETFDRLVENPRFPQRLSLEKSERFLGGNDLALPVLASESRMERYLRAGAAAGSEADITGSGAAIVVLGVSPEADGSLAQAYPDAKVFRCRTVGREEYQRRISPSGGRPWR